MNRRGRLPLLLAALFLAGAAGALDFKKLDMDKLKSGGEKLVKGARKISDDEEAALGRETASYLCARYGLLKDAELTQYVNLVGLVAARHGERPEIPYRFGVLDTDEVNAYAGPGGYIFITKGLLSRLKDEAELAGVLAHEVGHVAKRHIAREIQKSNLLQGSLEVATAGRRDSESFKALNGFTVGLLFKGFSRKDEEEADRAGAGYAHAAGYGPAGLERVLERLAAEKPGDNALKALGKSHPPASERLKTVRREIDERGYARDGAVNAERFTAATARLR